MSYDEMICKRGVAQFSDATQAEMDSLHEGGEGNMTEQGLPIRSKINCEVAQCRLQKLSMGAGR